MFDNFHLIMSLSRLSLVSSLGVQCVWSLQDVALVYLLSGALLVSQRVAEGGGEVHMFTAYPGMYDYLGLNNLFDSYARDICICN